MRSLFDRLAVSLVSEHCKGNTYDGSLFGEYPVAAYSAIRYDHQDSPPDLAGDVDHLLDRFFL